MAPERQKAGLFDIRNIIGALLFLYGVVLLVMGVVSNSSADEAKDGGINANLWVGLVLVGVGVFFGLWAYLRPIVVPADVDKHADPDAGPPAH
jgi:hypothetical protein